MFKWFWTIFSLGASDVFQASVLRFFIVYFKRFYDEYLSCGFHYLPKFKPLDDFFPSKTWLQISLCIWSVYVQL